MLVAEDDREKRAFNDREGKFQWKVMPFGLCNVPASFQTFMNRILRPFIGKFVVVYLDDFVVYFKSLEDRIQHLTQIFEVLRLHALCAKPSKCGFAVSTFEFCGHWQGDGNSPLFVKGRNNYRMAYPYKCPQGQNFLGYGHMLLTP